MKQEVFIYRSEDTISLIIDHLDLARQRKGRILYATPRRPGFIL